MKKRLFSFLALAMVALCGQAETDNVPGLIVEYLAEGTEDYSAALASVARVEFKDGLATLVFSNDQKEQLGEIASLRRISFGSITKTDDANTTATDAASALTVTAYPNPVADVLHVTGQAEGATLRLIAADGKVVATTTSADVPVSGLRPGIYFLQCGSQLFKVVKK